MRMCISLKLIMNWDSKQNKVLISLSLSCVLFLYYKYSQITTRVRLVVLNNVIVTN